MSIKKRKQTQRWQRVQDFSRDVHWDAKDKQFVIYSERAKMVLSDRFPDEEQLLDLDGVCTLDLLKFTEKWHVIEFLSKHHDWMVPVWDTVKQHARVGITRFNNMVSQKKITYDDLHYIFFKGQKVKIEYALDNSYIAGEIIYYEKETCYSYRRDNYTVFTVQFVKGDGHKGVYSETEVRINKFQGYKMLSDLPISLLTPEEESQFCETGLKVIKYLTHVHFVHVKGSAVQQTRCGAGLKHFTGRCIIDESNDNQNSDDTPDTRKDILPEILGSGKQWMIIPYLGIYNIERKEWGRVHVSKLYPIEFSQNAFERVVMDSTKKNFIKTVVEYGMNNNKLGKPQFQDIINGKSGGLIFLLKGNPGLGKTLIAESTAEHLQCPLLSITAGELGTESSSVEHNLQRYIDLCKRWNAILLIDEADVFMEQRDNIDIDRNSMVTVFLRILERLDGILFLTTNRHANIDNAIKSRMTFQLEYHDFTKEERKQVWKNLLTGLEHTIQLSDDDISSLADIALNGREIKHAIKLSIAAQGDKPVITLEDIRQSISFL